MQTPARKFSRKAQSGQAIVLVAFIMIGLIGALGLAIDGGGLLFLYRDIQNATDAAIVAATYARCTNATSANIISAGLAAAAENGFNNDGVTNWVTVRNPPPGGVLPAGVTANDYVQVTVRASKPSYFIQLVYPQPLEVTNGSVGHCRPAFDATSVPGFFGISGYPGTDTCSKVIEISGSTWTVDGDMHSNTDVDPKGGGGGIVIDGNVTYVTDIKPNNKTQYNGTNSQVSPRPDPLASAFPIRYFEPGGAFWNNVPSGLRTYISAASLGGNGRWSPTGQLEGLYYVEGDVQIGHPNVGAQGVTIVATGTIHIIQAGVLNYYSGPGSTGILFYSGADTSCVGNAIQFSGSGLSSGVVYAPRGEIQGSHSNGTWVGAIVGERIQFSGSSSTFVVNPFILRGLPPQVEIAQ